MNTYPIQIRKSVSIISTWKPNEDSVESQKIEDYIFFPIFFQNGKIMKDPDVYKIIFVSEQTTREISNCMFAPSYSMKEGWRCERKISSESRNELLHELMSVSGKIQHEFRGIEN